MVSKAARAGTPGTERTRRQHLGLLPVGYRFMPGASRRLRVARANHDRTHRAVQPEEATQQGSQALEGAPVSLRHTFLTRLGQSGCDVWTLARIAGHSSIAISARYVHPSEDAILDATTQLGGHNSRYSAESQPQEKRNATLLTA